MKSVMKSTQTSGLQSGSCNLQLGFCCRIAKQFWLGAASGPQLNLPLRGQPPIHIRLFQAFCSYTLTDTAGQLETLFISIQICLAAGFECCFSSSCCASLGRGALVTGWVITGALGHLQPPGPGGHRPLRPPSVSASAPGKEELDATLQMWLRKRQKEGNNHFLRPAGSALANAIQYPLAFIVHAHTPA